MHGRSSERGATLIILTVALSLVVIPLMGLAIDGTTLYLVRIKLSQAVDAAALAGARSLSTGLDLPSQAGSATSTALGYLNSNFPSGLMGATFHGTPTIGVTQDATVSRTVLVQASVDVPTTFMRVAGFSSTTVSATGQATRRDVNLMLVVDRSSSMEDAHVCPTMVANAQAFVDKFSDGRDILGLITFTQSVAQEPDFAPTTTFKSSTPSLSSVLGDVNCGGNTGSAQALSEAYRQIKAVNEPGRLNVIVFFTDGRPNGIRATFPVKTLADTRYIYSNTSTLAASPPSTCSSGTILHGVIAQWAGGAAKGTTAGVFNKWAGDVGDTSSPSIGGASGCAFVAKRQEWMSSDVANIPPTDYYGNSTTGYQTSAYFPPGASYEGKIRPDTPTSIIAASMNAADDAAKKIRADTKFNTVIFSLGLGGTSTEPLDLDFLRRVANDSQASSYDSTRPAGRFYYAADISQLSAAYDAVASQILRLSK